jgi:hypothetical protein
MNPLSPFGPTWLPDRLLVTNTLLVEAVLAFAFFWFVVRRAEKRRRALAFFLASLAIVGSVEALALIELLGEPVPHLRVYSHMSPRSGKTAIFQLDWVESRLLGRSSLYRVAVTWTPAGASMSAPSVRDQLPPDLFAELWPVVARDPVFSGVGPEPEEKARIGRALWEAVERSRLVAADPAIAAIVSRDRD